MISSLRVLMHHAVQFDPSHVLAILGNHKDYHLWMSRDDICLFALGTTMYRQGNDDSVSQT